MRVSIAQTAQGAFKITVEETKQSYLEPSLKSAMKLAAKLKDGEAKGKVQC